MTRETKIGLLVGLAFIIVIGILLSDYNRNETQTAALPLVADNVRNSTATLRNGSAQNEVVPPPAPAIPTRPVPTHEDLQQESRVNIGPGGSGSIASNAGIEVRVAQPTPPTPIFENQPTPGPRNNVATPGNGRGGAIEDTVTYEPHPPTPAPPVTPVATVNGARQYVAIESDTVSKLAGRFLGGNTKTNREAILALNPTLKANPNNVIVGRTYMIPPKTAPGTTPTATPTPPIHPIAAAPAPAPTDGPHYTYTVKAGDNLWKIAAEQLGDGTASAAIKELNQDVLKGRDDVRPNMRLRLPAKPIASAN